MLGFSIYLKFCLAFYSTVYNLCIFYIVHWETSTFDYVMVLLKLGKTYTCFFFCCYCFFLQCSPIYLKHHHYCLSWKGFTINIYYRLHTVSNQQCVLNCIHREFSLCLISLSITMNHWWIGIPSRVYSRLVLSSQERLQIHGDTDEDNAAVTNRIGVTAWPQW